MNRSHFRLNPETKEEARNKLAKKVVKKAHGATALSGVGLKRAARKYNKIAGEDDYINLQQAITNRTENHDSRKLKYGHWRNEHRKERTETSVERKKNRHVARFLGHAALMYGIRTAAAPFGPVASIGVGVGVLAAETLSDYAGRMARAQGDINSSLRFAPSDATRNYVDELIVEAKGNRKKNSAELTRAFFNTKNLGRVAGMAVGFGMAEYFGDGREVADSFSTEAGQAALEEKVNHLGNAVIGGSLDAFDAATEYDYGDVVNDAKEVITSVPENIANIDPNMPDVFNGDEVSASEADANAEAKSPEAESTEAKPPVEEQSAAEYNKQVVIKEGDGLTNIVNRMTEGGPGSARPMIDQAMEMGLGDVEFADGTPMIEMVDGEPHLTRAGVMPQEAVDILARAAEAKNYDLAA